MYVLCMQYINYNFFLFVAEDSVCYKNPIVTFTLLFYNILFCETSQKVYALLCIKYI
jgi:hypothetical protein